MPLIAIMRLHFDHVLVIVDAENSIKNESPWNSCRQLYLKVKLWGSKARAIAAAGRLLEVLVAGPSVENNFVTHLKTRHPKCKSQMCCIWGVSWCPHGGEQRAQNRRLSEEQILYLLWCQVYCAFGRACRPPRFCVHMMSSARPKGQESKWAGTWRGGVSCVRLSSLNCCDWSIEVGRS